MKRGDVYKLIDGERDYQDSRENHSAFLDGAAKVADWIIYMEYQLQEAKKAVYFLRSDIALEHVRKVTALGIVCMENNETSARKADVK